MKNTPLILSVLLITILVFSCKKKKEPEVVDTGEAYYPTTLGSYVVYNVDSIVFDEFTYDSTFYKYQIKEKIEEEYTDQQGRPALKLVRYIKKFNAAVSYSAMPWVIKDVWQVNVTKRNVEVVEENVRFVKMIFPVKVNSTWNGNSTNTLDEWIYKYSYMDNSETIGGIPFPKVTMVVQKDFPTLISRQYYTEKYAKEVGLVSREITDITFKDTIVPLGFPLYNVRQKYGKVYKATVTSYGVE